MHALTFLNPGHFHAALTLRDPNPRVAADIKVYAEPGPELDTFIALVEAFNAREISPTHWRLDVQRCETPLSRLMKAHDGGIVVIAGRNNTKVEQIATLHAAGFAVFADKPWLTSPESLEMLQRVCAGPPPAVDIMTGRADRYARLRKLLVDDAQLFGEFANDGEAAIELRSVHHLYKRVNGRPLARPAWYFDTRIQGDGLTDIQTHMVDQAQWLTERLSATHPGTEGGAMQALQLDGARRWATPVPLELFTECTGAPDFPQSLAGARDDAGVLQLQCNGCIAYRANGVRVLQHAEWYQSEPPGGGDHHFARIRGSRCEIRYRLGPDTGFKRELSVRAVGAVALDEALQRALQRWQGQHPGVSAKPLGERSWQIVLPADLDGGHERHFAIMLDAFLDQIEIGQWSAATASRISARYALLAAAQRRVQA